MSGEEEGRNELLGSGYFQMPFALVREGKEHVWVGGILRGLSNRFFLLPCAEIEQNLREKYQQLRDLIHHLEANRGMPAIWNGWSMHACPVTSGWA